MPKQHTENLFGIISGLFEESGLSFENLDGVAVAGGLDLIQVFAWRAQLHKVLLFLMILKL